MLTHLSVKNYALIDSLDLDLHQGFSTITGETGAGKSIILGALSHILGRRADLKSLRDNSRKCVIEGTFQLNPSRFKPFFEREDLDFENPTIIRREITPSGKSRAFINDTPVNLDILNSLAVHLIDVHSQHQNLLLTNREFQLDLLDSFAGNTKELKAYQTEHKAYKTLLKEKERLLQLADSEVGDADYLQFLFEELEAAQLQPSEQEDLERELELIENSGEIQSRLSESLQLIDADDGGVRNYLQRMHGNLMAIKNYDPDLESLAQRLESLRIELDDIRLELEQKAGDTQFDPAEQQRMDQRLSQLISLQKKHHVDSVEALIEKKMGLEQRINDISSLEHRQEKIEGELSAQSTKLAKVADALSESRKQVIPKLESEINEVLRQLNMPHAHFSINLVSTEQYSDSGKDDVNYLFTANKGRSPELLSKVASGGEISRVMLALKAKMAQTKSLPTIIFDEIDTGVSGETAGKIGNILAGMGKLMQVISITHLPQIASLGAHHYKVFKESDDEVTRTTIIPLDENQRVEELARLLSGDKVSEAALANAKTLLAAKA